MHTIKLFRQSYQISYLILLALVIASTWQSIQHTDASWLLITAVRVLPLLAFAPAVFKVNIRGLIWLCFVLCLYFTDAVVHSMTVAPTALNIGMAIFSAGLFIFIMLFIKANAKARKACA
ncbi:hypothetical protein BTA51_15120 [Hahella sp. CCB-MM4]|uniref:DUF2069 domain-containing protein n=1 Tax=Hahella sp. (strain CCB-MM4) TaxID=1926491 RepID=UPI000B9C2E7F|nr:DUF2069 domain-containing protein [Hahella sp. CCB-MM4]OZG72456.1 hypothetical protein BTA51_15120 [Hahella sp. CCB-MM4]